MSRWQSLRGRLGEWADGVGQRLARARPALVWLLLMACAVPMSDLLKPLDWRVLDALQASPRQWPRNVALVDLGWDFNPAGTPAYRRHIADTVRALAALEPPPAVVVMDVALSTTPIEIDTLRAAFDALRARHVRLVQATDLGGFAAGLSRTDALEHQGLAALHDYKGAWFGHTRFDYSDGGTAWYAPCAEIAALPGEECLHAVPRLVARHVAGHDAMPQGRADALATVLVPGDARLAAPSVWAWSGTGGWQAPTGTSATAAQALGGRVVVVGNLKHDRVGPWPGPVLLGWAIGDATALPDSERTALLRRPLWTLGFALAFSAVALGVFASLRRLDPRARHLGLTAAATVAVAVGLLAALVLGLRHGLQLAFFQVGYVLLAIADTTAVAWHTARAGVLRRALYTLVSTDGPAAPTQWDVFISYSHTPSVNAERVRRDVWEPLRRLRTADGALRVFFDESSIRVGTSWFLELAEGIERSRCFVALYSSDYFRKSFCQFEIRKAMVRDIATPDSAFVLLPFQLDPDANPPPEFSHVQFKVPQTPGELIEQVRAALAAQGIHTV